MPTKKTKKKEAPVVPVEDMSAQESHPHPRQVVEVVIEEDSATHEPVSAEASVVERLAPEEPQEEPTPQEEKRKEMVGELFGSQPPVDQQEEEVKEIEEVPLKEPEPSVMPEITVHKKSSVRPILMWAAIVVVVAALTGGGLMMVLGGGVPNFPSIAIAPTPTPTEAPTPTPTPTPEPVDKEAVTIEVLNGSGEKGVAASMKSVLEDAGYTVTKMGNAENFDYEKTEIHVKADKEAYLAALVEDLKGSYTIGTKTADLSEDSPYDVQIIIGKE